MAPQILTQPGSVIALLLVGAVGVSIFISRRRRALLRVTCTAAFHEAFCALMPSPILEIRYLYGVPAFKVKFATSSQLDTAEQEGRLARFTESIENLCKNNRFRTFVANRAIFFTYQGQIEEKLRASKSRKERGGVG